mmetsp:Transcript_130938/g.378842  ORF Transcript_130938/g.378842 Transcript_130938/m.378842 type:complete len:533 (-) Transcript_130938:171-1769(-)
MAAHSFCVAAVLCARLAAAVAYNQVVALSRQSNGCSCSCRYVGGMCRAGALDDACCQDVCCGAGVAFPDVDGGHGDRGNEVKSLPGPTSRMAAPLRGMMLRPAGDIAAYNHPIALMRQGDGCSCSCRYVGGMCRAGELDDACCQDICCGANVDFPSFAIDPGDANRPVQRISGRAVDRVAPSRGMLLPLSSAAGPEPYNSPISVVRHSDGCRCTCSYVGGMCRSTGGCCEQMCCGADVEYPSADFAPARGMSLRVPPDAALTTLPSSETGTLSAAAACFEEGVAWTPGMVAPSQESNTRDCQARCADTVGCTRFSFFSGTGACQLHDMFSARVRGLSGFVSGPFSCWEKVDHDKYAKVDEQTILPKAFSCIELGASWLPVLGVDRRIEGSLENVTQGCRQACRDEAACEHFTITVPNTCHLSGAAAKKVGGNPMMLSDKGAGCDDGNPELSMKSASGFRSLLPRPGGAWRLVAFGGGVLVVAMAAVGFRHRWRASPHSHLQEVLAAMSLRRRRQMSCLILSQDVEEEEEFLE